MEEFLNQAEPYTSYRYVLGLVLLGLTVYFVVTSILSLKNLQGLLNDLNRQVNDQRLFDDVRLRINPDWDITNEKPLRARPGRIIKLALISAMLRMMSWRTFIHILPELLAVITLASASAVAYWYVFTLKM